MSQNVPKKIEFDPSLVQYTLSDEAKAIMQTLSDNVFIIEEVSDSAKSYEQFVTTLLNNMHYGFEHLSFRECKTNFKFRNDKNEPAKCLPYRDFIVNAIFWYPQVIIDVSQLDDSFILPSSSCRSMNAKIQKKYMDDMYLKRYRQLDNLSGILHDCTQFLRQISLRFNKYIGLAMNVHVFMDLEKRIPEYGELLRFHVDETKQPADIEKDIQDAAAKQVELILNDTKFNTLKAILQPRAAKEKQLSEVQTLIGLKPDDQGKTIPKPINTNYLISGLHKLSNLFIEAVSGRTASIINTTMMGVAGHLLILTATLAASAKLEKRPSNCGSPNLIPVEITDHNILRRINLRKYKLAGSKEFRTIDFDKDTDLIGETVYMRSPITCACKNGKVCKECYGDLWYRNKDLNSAGAYAGFIQMNPVAQGLLSAKHHQGTSSFTIKFNDGFEKYFIIDSTDIIIRNDIDEVESYKLIIRVDDIGVMSDDDSGDMLNISNLGKRKKRTKKQEEDEYCVQSTGDFSMELMYYTKTFYVAKYYGSKKHQTMEQFQDVDEKELFIHKDLLDRMTMVSDPVLGNILTLELDNIDISEFVFLVELDNNGVTKPLKEIKQLLATKTHGNCNTYEDMVTTMMRLNTQAGIDINSVHSEMIIRQLIRKRTNKIRRPDFGRLIMRQDYDIMTVNNALKYSPSLSTSLNTAFLKYQLVQMCETDEKRDTSDFDLMFATTLNLDESVKHSGGRISQ